MAAKAFTKLTELEPKIADNHIALGDCYLNLKQYDKAIVAYEAATELVPEKRNLWEILHGLYNQVNNTEGAARAKAKLKSLK